MFCLLDENNVLGLLNEHKNVFCTLGKNDVFCLLDENNESCFTRIKMMMRFVKRSVG